MAVNTDIDFTGFEEDPRQWFAAQGEARKLRYFLAHDDDGVIWGRIDQGQLKLSGEAFPEYVNVPLRALTLQQARLFDEAGELLVWRGDDGWRGRFFNDDGEEILNDEIHRLWGTASDPPGPKDGFTLMRDGDQGLLHAPPLTLPRDARAALTVRHYVDYDEQGQAYIALSRLVAVQEGGN